MKARVRSQWCSLLTSLAVLAGGTEICGSGVHGLEWSLTGGPDFVCALRNCAECGLGAFGSFYKQQGGISYYLNAYRKKS